MMRDIKESTKRDALYLMLVAALIMCLYFIIVSTGLSQRVLAGSLLVTIIVGGFINVWKIFKSADESKRVADSFDSISNTLDELNSKVDEIIEQQDEKLGLDKERRVDEVRDRKGRSPF